MRNYAACLGMLEQHLGKHHPGLVSPLVSIRVKSFSLLVCCVSWICVVLPLLLVRYCVVVVCAEQIRRCDDRSDESTQAVRECVSFLNLFLFWLVSLSLTD
jgi:hypothetical protein